MAVPFSQMFTVAKYVFGKKVRGVKRYPLVLMLEPLFRCNLACAGCGKIQYPGHILRKELTPDQCFKAVEECGVPMVAIPGGEPLMHPHIVEIVDGLIARKKYVYLCSNGILLGKRINDFKPSKYLTFSIHLDGPREEHDLAVARDGTYDKATESMKIAINAGFRVTTNTTLYDRVDPERYAKFFDELMAMGVEGMMVAPGYHYQKAPDQDHFLHRQKTIKIFQELLGQRKRSWKFNLSPVYLRFLMGRIDFDCTPWGNPTYCLFGWQKPCYLLQEGYCDTFKELMETTPWEKYGRKSGNEKCADCMVHCGFEPTSVDLMFSIGGVVKFARAAMW